MSCSYSGGFVHRTGPNIGGYLNTAGQGSGKSSALSAAMNAWTKVPNADPV